jgi:hypothetical protein
MTISFEEFKARLLADPKVKEEYDALGPEFETARKRANSAIDPNLAANALSTRKSKL